MTAKGSGGDADGGGGGGEIVLKGSRQGLTLVHFSAQPERFLIQNTPLKSPNSP
jgi:hypothetical protein